MELLGASLAHTLHNGVTMKVSVSDVSVVNLAPGASVALAHGIVLQDGSSAAPYDVVPFSASPITVSAISNTTITFTNPSNVAHTSRFRCTRDPMINEAPPSSVGWGGAADEDSLRTVFVWREGAAATLGNVYKNFADLYADLILVAGPKVIQLDASANGGLAFTLSTMGSAYNLNSVIWESLGYTFFFGYGYVALANGVTISANQMSVTQNTQFVFNSASVVWSITTPTRLFIEEGSQIHNTGAASPMQVSGGTSLTIIGNNGMFGTNGFTPLVTLAVGSTLRIEAGSGFTVAANCLSDGGVASTIQYVPLDPGATLNPQSGITGSTPVVIPMSNFTWNNLIPRQISGTTTQTILDGFIFATIGAIATISLLSTAVQNGRIVVIKNSPTSTAILTVNSTTGQTFDGGPQILLAVGKSVIITAMNALPGWQTLAIL